MNASTLPWSTARRAPRRYAAAAHIAELDGRRDDEQIVRLIVNCAFPFDAQRAMELAFFKTFGIPAIARVLVGTGKFIERPHARVADTDALMNTLVQHGYRNGPGRQALAAIRRAHGSLRPDTDLMRYVLGTFIFEPIRWVERFGWRRLLPQEREAAFHFWCGVGAGLGITTPDSPERYAAFYDDFEARHMTYHPANHELATAVREFFLSPFPAVTRPAGRHAVHALLDPRLRTACRLPDPPAWAARAVPALVRARSRAAAQVARGWSPVVRGTSRPAR